MSSTSLGDSLLYELERLLYRWLNLQSVLLIFMAVIPCLCELPFHHSTASLLCHFVILCAFILTWKSLRNHNGIVTTFYMVGYILRIALVFVPQSPTWLMQYNRLYLVFDTIRSCTWLSIELVRKRIWTIWLSDCSWHNY